MTISVRKPSRGLPLLALTLLAASAGAQAQDAREEANAAAAPAVDALARLPESARQQISALLAEKESRTAVQRKIGSSLIYMLEAKSGAPLLASVPALRPLVAPRPDGRVDVEILGAAGKALALAITNAGGELVSRRLDGAVLRAIVPLEAVEGLAAQPGVLLVRATVPPMTNRMLAERRQRMRPTLRQAVEKVQRKTAAAAGRAPVASAVTVGAATSEGLVAHRVDEAFHVFGATGAGVRIGVLSDSDDFKESSIATGDLPADTLTVPGQDGRPGSGEGTAMMEIVHDLAPGAKLFFATAFNSPESFADNIRTLRFTYGCDIIVDDVIYFFESPYQDDIIAKAVNDVTASGGMYFSSAGNQGNFNDGTSGTWEGDFKKAKVLLGGDFSGYEIHDFGGGVIADRIEAAGGPLILHWSDPGSLDNPQAADDYDLFVLDQDLRNVIVASTDVQDGTGLPFEFLGFFIPPNFRVVIARHEGATDRAVRILHFGGELALSTSGGTYGHSSAAEAFGVAAVDVAEAPGGVFAAGPQTPIELYSTDGNRRIFFDPSGAPIKPGKFLFKNNGGELRKKPEVSAADGVSTTLPGGSGLNPFFGTSAAAPHAAAIAGLIKAAVPSLTPAKIRSALTSTALDIEGFGRDRDSGFGIVDAFAALSKVRARPVAFLELSAVGASESGGDGDGFIEPGESASVLTTLTNLGGAPATHVSGVLSTSTPGVTVGTGLSTWPDIPPAGGTGVNSTPFTLSVAPTATCGTAAALTLTASYSNDSPASPKIFSFKVQTGQPSSTATTTSYTGPAAPIPDDNPAGVNVPLSVTQTGAISNLVFSIDGATCTTAAGATTVGIDHTWVGDLRVRLTSPSGTTVTLIQQAGGAGNSGNNFCQTVLDDSAAASIQNVLISNAPFTGTFKPANPLAAFIGEEMSGTWTLNVTDLAFIDTGSVRAFSLHIKGYTCN